MTLPQRDDSTRYIVQIRLLKEEMWGKLHLAQELIETPEVIFLHKSEAERIFQALLKYLRGYDVSQG